jgi:hypothetical protein
MARAGEFNLHAQILPKTLKWQEDVVFPEHLFCEKVLRVLRRFAECVLEKTKIRMWRKSRFKFGTETFHLQGEMGQVYYGSRVSSGGHQM